MPTDHVLHHHGVAATIAASLLSPSPLWRCQWRDCNVSEDWQHLNQAMNNLRISIIIDDYISNTVICMLSVTHSGML